MKYVVDIGGARREVTIDGDQATLDGRTVPVQVEEVAGTPVVMLRLGDASHRLVVQREGTRGRYALRLHGHKVEVEALDERARAIRDMAAASAGPTGPQPVKAPMPGLVVKVLVAPGDVVAAGQGVVVMEAMKMENELRAAAAGTVTRVLATAGAAVERGALLVEFA